MLYGSVEEDLMLMVEAADFFVKNPVKTPPPVPCGVVLRCFQARVDRSEKALHTKFVDKACLLPGVYGCEVAGDAGSIEVWIVAVSEQQAPVLLQLAR